MVEITTNTRVNITSGASIILTGTGYVKFITGFKGYNGSSPFLNNATKRYGPVDTTGGTIEIDPTNTIDYDIIYPYTPAVPSLGLAVAKYDAVLVIGQSNTHYGGGEDGTNSLDPYLDYVFDNVKQYGRGGLYDKQVVPAIEPLMHNSSDPGRNGFCTEFARQYISRGLLEQGRDLLLLPCALGGSGFDDGTWNPGDAIYEDAVARTNEILDDYPGSRLVAVLWHQGEDDLNAMTHAAYSSAFFSMLDDLRARTGSTVPFICGGLVPYWVRTSRAEARNAVITGLATQRVNMGYASPGSPTIIAKADDTIDSIHFSNIGQRELGRRYFDAWLDAKTRTSVPARGIWARGDMYMHMNFENGIVDSAGNVRNAQLLQPSTIVTDATRGSVLSMPDATRAAGGVDLTDDYTLGNKGYTKSAWINLIDGGNYNNILSSRIPGGSSGAVFWIRGDGGNTRLSGGTAGSIDQHGEYPFASEYLNTWVHVAVSYDKDTGRVLTYLNGTVVLSGNEPLNSNLTNGEIIGGFSPADNRFYGLIDDVRVWHRPLSVEEIANVYLQTVL